MDADEVLEHGLRLGSHERMRLANALLESLVDDGGLLEVVEPAPSALGLEPESRRSPAIVIDFEEARRRREA